MLRCHTPELVERVRDGARLDRRRHDLHRDDVRGGAARRGRGDRGGAARGLRARRGRPATTPSAARPMGFCLFNSIAIAARWAQAELGLERVAIVDWDVHHGNGTQDIVAGDPSILFVSLHQWPLYPGTGGPDEQGETLVNIPLAAGTGRRGLPRGVRRRSRRRSAVRARPAARLGRLRRARRRPARRPGADRGRLPRAGAPRRALAPRVAAVLEGGYNLRDAARPGRERRSRFRLLDAQTRRLG